MDVMTDRHTLPLLADHVGFVRSHVVRLSLLALAGLLAGLFWSQQQPPAFSATASVALSPVPAYVSQAIDEPVPPAVSIDTDAQLLQGPLVRDALAQALDVDPAETDGHLSLSASPHSRVLHVTVTAEDAAAAARGASAAAEALVQARRAALGSLSTAQLRQLRFRVENHERLLSRHQSRRLVVPARDELFGQVLLLREALAELEAVRATPAEVIRAAQPPQAPDHANHEVSMSTGAMLGLALGCVSGARREKTRARTTHQGENDHAI